MHKSEIKYIPPIIQGYYDTGKIDLKMMEQYISIVLNVK